MSSNYTSSQFIKPKLSCLSIRRCISTVILILFLSATNVYSAQVTIVWNPNNESDLAGYKIYYGSLSGNYDSFVDVGNQTSYPLSGLVEGETYYIALTAYDINGNESGYSGELFYTVPPNSQPLNCSSPTVHCVDDNTGNTQEYSTIQSAVDNAGSGDTVLVHEGTYQGFRVTKSGTSTAPLTVKAINENVVVNSVGPRGGNDNIYLQDVNYVTIDGFRVLNAPTYGIASHDASASDPMRGIIIRNNHVSNSGKENIYISQTSESLIENNHLHDAVAHGLYISNAGSDNTTIRNNVIYNNDAGIHFNGDISQGGDGIIKGIIIENNIIHDNRSNGINQDGVQNSIIRNNLIFRNKRHGVRGYSIDSAAGPANMVIYNNTFYDNGSTSIKMTADNGGHVIFNNIMLSKGSPIIADNTNISSDYNIVSGQFSLNNEGSYLSLEQWQALGHGVHSFSADASTLFENVNSNIYSLQSTASAVDAGTFSFSGVNAINIDQEGKQRPIGILYDIGALEYGTGNTDRVAPNAPENLRIVH